MRACGWKGLGGNCLLLLTCLSQVPRVAEGSKPVVRGVRPRRQIDLGKGHGGGR